MNVNVIMSALYLIAYHYVYAVFSVCSATPKWLKKQLLQAQVKTVGGIQN